MSSLYSSFSGGNLRRRKGFHGLNENLLGPVISVVGGPADMDDNEQEDDGGGDTSTFNVDFGKLASMASDKNNNVYLDEVGGVDELAMLLNTSTINGIRGDTKDLRRRRHEFGSNAYWWQNKSRRPVNQDLLGFKRNQWFLLIVVQLCFFMWFLMELLLPKVLSLWNIVGICACVLAEVCFWLLLLRMHTTAEECEKLLNKTDELKSKVVRDGLELPPIPAHEVVVGDLVLLKKGDWVPADGISLGEDQIKFMICGNIVLEDNRMLVTSVGENTIFGQDMSFTSYFMQTRQNIEEILMFRWFTKRVQNQKNQTPDSDNIIEIGIVNDNDRRFLKVNLEGLQKLVMEKNYDHLTNEFGGVSGVIEALESNRQNGIKGDASDLHQRKSSFRSNTFNLCQVPSRKVVLWSNLIKALFGYTCFNAWFPVEVTLGIKFSKYGAKDWWFVALGFYILGVLIGCGQIILKEIDRRCPCYKLKTPLKEYDNAQVQLSNAKIQAIRNGIRKCIPVRDLVVGDIVQLRKGNLIPADGLYVDGNSLQLENGFGMIEEKKGEDPFMLFGSVVSHGQACMLVTAVGENNSYAKSHLHSGIHKPLQSHFEKLLSYKEGISVLSVVIVPLLLVVRYIRGKQTNEDGVLEMLLATITVMMKSAFRIKSGMLETRLWNLFRPDKFAREVNAVVTNRRLDMFDWLTAGKITTIIADEKSMREVVEFRIKSEIINNVASKVPREVLEGLRQAVSLCSISEFVNPAEETLVSWGEFELGINKTELIQNYIIEDSDSEDKLTWTLMRMKSDVERARHVHCRGDAEMLLPRCSDYHDNDGTKNPLDEDLRMKIKESIQDMKAKNLQCIALAYKHIRGGGGYDGVEADDVDGGSKGERKADDEYDGGQNREVNVYEEDGVGGPCGEAEADQNDREVSYGERKDAGGCNTEVRSKKNDGGLAGEKETLRQTEKEELDVEKNGLTLLGIVGLSEEKRKTLQSLENMGINVKMVSSGNAIGNAITVAKGCGILAPNQKEDEVVVDAEAYRRCSVEEVKCKMAARVCVMLRATSMDKRQLVEYLKKNDQVVAVIGTSEEDASVVKEADVGFVMESRITPTLRQEAEFLIADGTLTSIYKTLKWMRWLHNCLIKFIQLQLVVQIPVFILNSTTTYFSGVTHITDFVLFILDTVLPLLAIPTTYQEQLTEEHLMKFPVGRSVVVTVVKAIWKGVIVQGSLLTAILLLVHFCTGKIILGWTKTDIMKTILIAGQILNIVTIGLWRKNKWKDYSRRMLFILVVALFIPTIDFRFLRNEWVACAEIFGLSSAIGFFMLFYKICGELETVIHEY